MKSNSAIKSILRGNLDHLRAKYPIQELALFGSYAREEQTEHSDVDIMVKFAKPVGLEFLALAEELEDLLDEKVDLVSRNGIKEKYYRAIEDELEYV